MPNKAGSFILTDYRRKGVTERRMRRLQVGELAKAKGVPSLWGSLDQTPCSEVERSPGVHTLAAIGESIFTLFQSDPALNDAESRDDVPTATKPLSEEDAVEWSWHLPDLSPESEWTKERLQNLREAISGRT